MVEIAARKKTDGWFLHALTGETWLLKLKFRVGHNAVRCGELVEQLKLKTLNQMEDLPVYGNEARARCKRLRGPWQEIEIRAHTLDEVDTPAFWNFLDTAVRSFQQLTHGVAIDDIMPWKKLGQRWHLMRKGFPVGRRVAWDPAVLEPLIRLLEQTAPKGQFLWTNQVQVPITLPGRRDPWAVLYTKKAASLDLYLFGPKNAVGLGRFASLARDRDLDATRSDCDVVRLRFVSASDLNKGDLAQFLAEHLAIAAH